MAPCDHSEWAPECPFCNTPHVAFTEEQLIALVEYLGMHDRFSGSPYDKTKATEPFIKAYYARDLQSR